MKTTTDNEYIQKLVAEGEHVHQDFKFAISDARKIAKSLSAFSNTKGGRLLVGIKDNGRIAGIRSEEEIYMIEAAADLYCLPPIKVKKHIYKAEGKDILEVEVAESREKPICALNEKGKAWAYVRIKDENILANPVHLKMWKKSKVEEEVVMAYTAKEQKLLNLLQQHKRLTLNQCCKLSHLSRQQTCELLADFIRFELVQPLFEEHTFYYRLSN